MDSKTNERRKTLTSEGEEFDVELALSELNQSVAYLSKMVLQLQRSFNDKPTAKPKAQKRETVH